MADVVLTPERDRSVRRRHPWVLSGSVARVEGDPQPGAWVRVLSADGEPLGVGHYSPRSQIRVRLLGFGKDSFDDDALAASVAASVARRAGDPLIGPTDAVRLVNAEGDGLPGLVADRYGDALVLRLSTAGMSARRELVVRALRAASGAAHGFERADAPAARREGFAARQGPLWGEAPSAPFAIRERERVYWVDLEHGQKTGFYLDQRDARDLVENLAAGRRVLDLFSYTGAFAAAAARGGARALTLVESSAEALRLAERNLEPWADTVPLRLVGGDAFRFVRTPGDRFDLLVVDPPPLARRRADVPRAARAAKDVLLFALRRADPGALVFAFTCSHHIGADLLRKIVFGAALDAGRPLQVLRELGAAADHPVSIDHPEGRYLSGLVLRA